VAVVRFSSSVHRAYLDRINVGSRPADAAATAFQRCGVWRAQECFFAGYFFFQVPSNLVLQRVAKRWIAVLMVTWGVNFLIHDLCDVAEISM